MVKFFSLNLIYKLKSSVKNYEKNAFYYFNNVYLFFINVLFNAENNLTNEILGDDSSYKSFTDLQSLIQGSSGVVELTDDYKYNSTIDRSDFSNGIFFSNHITIIGNSHSIDAFNKTKIFTITGSEVTLNNISFKILIIIFLVELFPGQALGVVF